MTDLDAASSGGSQQSRIALFGPQVSHWTREDLAKLQSALLQDAKVNFLTKALVQLPSQLSAFEKDDGVGVLTGVLRGGNWREECEVLQDFVTGKSIPDPQSLNNTLLASLTVISHTVYLCCIADASGNNDISSLWDFQDVQGFCIGFLSAVALASSNGWTDFERHTSSVLRLAVCIGAVVDAENESHTPTNRVTALSVRWKTAADRAYLETSLDLFPNAYISCITDDRTLTITLPKEEQKRFCSRLSRINIAIKAIGLNGCYHHPRHTEVARSLKRLCTRNKDLNLPDADKLRLPLRSTADAEILGSGALHDVAIDLILCKRAHWFQTVKLTVAGLPHGKFRFVPVQDTSCVPRSLLPGKPSIKNDNTDHHDITELPSRTEEVAVVGMACRFPQADSISEFWQLLRSGGTAVSKVPIERFDPANLTREPKLANFWGNFLRRPDAFDHRFFGISGREAKSMDPQQRLALQVSYEALESYGYGSFAPAEKETDVGCYLGVGSVDYEENVASENANAFSATGTLRAFITGRISHFFGWTGPSITFDTACSSSAVAIHTACKALLAGECSVALAGGVNVITGPNLYQNLSAASFLNPNGPSRAFDAAAGGYCRGEGAGILVLKPLSRAIVDGDTVVGVIAGSAVNQGSNCSPITVPDFQSQSSLYKQALSIGRIKPKEVTYVEAHGTGTPVGDPIEYESVRMTFTDPQRNEELFLGSVKDNIGHTEAASGAAAVIKTLLMMQHKVIPKQANFSSLNPGISFSQSDRITIPDAAQSWTARRHVALVNNYGAAGSNAAIVVREHLHTTATSEMLERVTNPHSSAVYPICLSAKSANSLLSYIDALRSLVPRLDTSFENLAYNIARRQNLSFEYRTAFTAGDTRHFVSVLDSLAARADETLVRTGKRPVVLSIGGQTGPYVTISRELYDNCDLLQKHLNECDAVCQVLGLPSIFPGIFQKDAVKDIIPLHCMLLSVQFSCAKYWLDCGIQVDTVIGHSFGQLTALCVADSISLEDAFRLVSGRARLIQDSWGSERGVMLSVECDRQEVETVLNVVNSTSDLRVDVACYNGPRSFVLAGNASSMEKVEEECRPFRTIWLDSTHAYHSYVADAILDGLREVADSVTIRPPSIHIETCSSDRIWSQFSAEEVVQHTRQPVYFAEAVERIAARLPSAVWLEAGSASPVIALTRRILRESHRSDTFIPIELGDADAPRNLADTACQLWKAGCTAQYWSFLRSSSHGYVNVDLPPYQFEEARHWIDYKPGSELLMNPLAQKKTTKEPELVTMVKSNTTTREQFFTVNTSNLLFDFAGRGHTVAGQNICPASMYIEIVASCALAITKRRSNVQKLPHIEGLTMTMPLGVGSGSAVFVRFHKYAEEAWDYAVFSQPPIHKSIEDGRTEHAKGRIRMTNTDDVLAEDRLDLLKKFARSSRPDRVLKSPSATGINGAIVYKLFHSVVEYAKYYHGVRSLSALENEAVGFVTVPADQPLGRQPIVCDPISLDNFLQVAGIHVNCLSHRKDDEVFMCTAIEEVIFSGSFITNMSGSREWTVYSRYDSISNSNMINDIFVYDMKSKDLVLAIMGANFRSVPFKLVVKSLNKFNATSTTARNKSDSDSDHTLDSGYQTRLPTPPNREHNNVSQKYAPFPGQLLSAPLPAEPRSQQQLGTSTKSSNPIQLVCEMFSDIMEIPVEEIKPTSKLDDLGIDSLLVTEVIAEVQKRFCVSITQAQFLECVDVMSLSRRIKPDEIVEGKQRPVDTPPEHQSLNNEFLHSSSGPAQENLHNHARSEEQAIETLAVLGRDCFIQSKDSYDQYAEATGFAHFCSEGFLLQSKLVVQYVVEALASLGCVLQAIEPGEKVPAFQYDPRHTKVVAQLYKLLERAGLIQKESNGSLHRTSMPVPKVPALTLHTKMLENYPKHASETKLLNRTASKLAECLSGVADPVGLIFQDSAARTLLEDVYTNAPMFKTGTLLLVEYLSSILERYRGSREVKILEVGAGTGGTTKLLVEEMARLDSKCKVLYTFTDKSSSLIAAARRKFAKWPFMSYAVLDVEKDPEPQFAGTYDIIVSTNCIHATKDLVRSTANIHKMLHPEGVLCLVELTRNLFWFDLVFGLLEGWWLFSDAREHALADEGRWQQCLRAAGFEWVDWTDSASEESNILRVITASPSKAIQLPDTDPPVNKIDNIKSSSDQDVRQTLTFKKVDGLDLLADIYYPSGVVDPGRSLPVALMIHGGGHIMLSRNDIRPEQTQMLLRSGFLPVSVDYRLCPETTLLEGPMADVADALAWVRGVLPQLSLARKDIRVNGERVVSVGWSTGGQLAMSLAWTSISRGVRSPEAIFALYSPTDYEDSFWTKPNNPAGSEVTAIGSADQATSYELDEETWAGVCNHPITSYNIPPTKRALGGWLAPSDPRSRLALYMNWHGRALHVLFNGLDKKNRSSEGLPAPTPTDIAAISPLAQIRNGRYTTPTFIIHPRQDDLIPWQHAQRTWEALRAKGIDAELRILEDVPHLFDAYREHQGIGLARRAIIEGYEFLCKHVGLTLQA